MDSDSDSSSDRTDSTDRPSFYERLNNGDWSWVMQKFREDHTSARSNFFFPLFLRRDAPTHFVKEMLEEQGRMLFNSHIVEIPGKEEAVRMPPLTIAIIFSRDETFALVLEHAQRRVEKNEKALAGAKRRKLQTHRAVKVFSNIGLIPLDRLRQICKHFPTRAGLQVESDAVLDYLLSRNQETATEAEATEKYSFFLKHRINLEHLDEQRYHNADGLFLAPHALFLLALSHPFDDRHHDDKVQHKNAFIRSGIPLLQFFQEQSATVPEFSLQQRNTQGESLLHLFLRNVSYRRKLVAATEDTPPTTNGRFPKDAALGEFCRWLVVAHPEAAKLVDQSGSLPIHIAAQEGIPVQAILMGAYHEGLLIKGGEETVRMYPFQLAALSLNRSMHIRDQEFSEDSDEEDDSQSTLREWRETRAVLRTYHLLRADPSVLSLCLLQPSPAP